MATIATARKSTARKATVKAVQPTTATVTSIKANSTGVREMAAAERAAATAKKAPVAKKAPAGIDPVKVEQSIRAAVERVRLAPKAQQGRMNINGVAVRGFAGDIFAAFGRDTEGQWFFAAVDATGTVHGQGTSITRTGAKAGAMKVRRTIAAGSRAPRNSAPKASSVAVAAPAVEAPVSNLRAAKKEQAAAAKGATGSRYAVEDRGIQAEGGVRGRTWAVVDTQDDNCIVSEWATKVLATRKAKEANASN